MSIIPVQTKKVYVNNLSRLKKEYSYSCYFILNHLVSTLSFFYKKPTLEAEAQVS